MVVVGARPNFMKAAPLIERMKRFSDFIDPILVHTGQHYDQKLSRLFFDELKMPKPDLHLGVGSGSHAVQTAKIMIEFEKAVLENTPHLVVVVGDVNSTLACALTAAKLHIKVAHVEAGLRSFDRTMPEEINRLLTDHMADYLFVSERSGLENLRKEGIPDEKVFFVGNVMIDTLRRFQARAAKSDIRKRLHLDGRDYAVLTLHREPAGLRGVRLGLEGAYEYAPVRPRLALECHDRLAAPQPGRPEHGLRVDVRQQDAVLGRVCEPCLDVRERVGL